MNTTKFRQAYLSLSPEEKNALAKAMGITYKKLSLLAAMKNGSRNPMRLEYLPGLMEFFGEEITIKDLIEHDKVRG